VDIEHIVQLQRQHERLAESPLEAQDEGPDPNAVDDLVRLNGEPPSERK